jgi:hypothetical protein
MGNAVEVDIFKPNLALYFVQVAAPVFVLALAARPAVMHFFQYGVDS